jgi:hypothetical protein
MLLGIKSDSESPALGENMVTAAGLLRARWPVLATVPAALAWLCMRTDLGIAPRTLDAYAFREVVRHHALTPAFGGLRPDAQQPVSGIEVVGAQLHSSSRRSPAS